MRPIAGLKTIVVVAGRAENSGRTPDREETPDPLVAHPSSKVNAHFGQPAFGEE